ncbi:MAG: SgcJ/EcaC family oxidoreductase [Planctomycetota bacterium]
MKHRALAAAVLIVVAGSAAGARASEVEAELRTSFAAYLDAFNEGDAAKVAAFWAPDAVSLNEETGQRTEGREAILEDMRAFFAESLGARLTGELQSLRQVAPTVVIAEGVATVAQPGGEATPSAFTVVMVKQDGGWLISSSQERDLPTPESSYDALKPLEWLVGAWRDDTEGVEVNTVVRWSPSKAFLIRSFEVDFGGGDDFQGTQIIGWDPNANEHRTWTFNSDGSFGEGTVTRRGDAWLVRVSEVGADGGVSTGTQVITLVDADTMRVERISQTVDGSPAPAGLPVTVRRVGADAAATVAEGVAEGGAE